MRHALALTLVYVSAGAAIAALWTVRARTENQSNRWASVVAIADGAAPRPFVKRRLLSDAARLVSRAVPAPLWRGASRAIDGRPALVRFVRGGLGWKRVDDPILLSAVALIGLSAAGFMAASRAVVLTLYDAPRAAADAAGLALGLALLGGGGDVRFGWFPYDIPHAFLFTLALAALLARSAWLVPAFAAAAYSKETAALLIPAYALAHPGRWRVATLAALCATFVLVRLPLDVAYGAGAGGFWFPGRNARWLARLLAFDAWWYYPVLIVCAVRVARLWPEFPAPLRRLSSLTFALLGLAVFKGWIEEKRQYLELLPILGPLALQWTLTELGLGWLLRAKEA